MALYKRGSIWWMSFTYAGKQVRKPTETTDKKLAQRIYDKIKGEIAEGKWFEKLPGESMTFREMMEKYMSEHSKINKAPKSYIRDKSLADHLVGNFGDMYLTEIAPKAIAEYKVMRRMEKASPKTVNNELVLMGHAYNMAIREWELAENNPVKKVAKEKVNNIIERWLTIDEEKALLKVSPKWLQEIISFAICTGLREGEILDLKWHQIDFSRKTLLISEQKNRCVDTLPLNDTALSILQTKFEICPTGVQFVFINGCATRINARNLIRAFHSVLVKAGIKNFRFHDLRHTFATRLVQNGVDLYTVQKLGRWKTISCVMRYAHHYPESLRSGINVMDKTMSGFITILSQHNEKGATVTP
jgi:integrase